MRYIQYDDPIMIGIDSRIDLNATSPAMFEVVSKSNVIDVPTDNIKLNNILQTYYPQYTVLSWRTYGGIIAYTPRDFGFGLYVNKSNHAVERIAYNLAVIIQNVSREEATIKGNDIMVHDYKVCGMSWQPIEGNPDFCLFSAVVSIDPDIQLIEELVGVPKNPVKGLKSFCNISRDDIKDAIVDNIEYFV